ncbi:MAG: hypothetical protein EON54_00380 [Alcaligenaceae bacterium]|nr:MAG: hypothetical protein EON54_00380 [Alcaligenaceae bacterium]
MTHSHKVCINREWNLAYVGAVDINDSAAEGEAISTVRPSMPPVPHFQTGGKHRVDKERLIFRA